MNWLAIDPEATQEVRVPDQPDGLLVEVGFWPPSIENKLRARLREVSFFMKPDQLPRTADEIEAQYERDDALLSEAVRWGIRGWRGEPAPVIEEVVLAGRKHKRLADVSVDRLRRNRLIPEMAVAATRFNIASPEGKGGSGAS